jgi:hypothetical protein
VPFQSEAQRRFMWAKHPEIAKRWAHEYPGQKNLPMHKGGKSRGLKQQRSGGKSRGLKAS